MGLGQEGLGPDCRETEVVGLASRDGTNERPDVLRVKVVVPEEEGEGSNPLGSHSFLQNARPGTVRVVSATNPTVPRTNRNFGPFGLTLKRESRCTGTRSGEGYLESVG